MSKVHFEDSSEEDEEDEEEAAPEQHEEEEQEEEEETSEISRDLNSAEVVEATHPFTRSWVNM